MWTENVDGKCGRNYSLCIQMGVIVKRCVSRQLSRELKCLSGQIFLDEELDNLYCV